MYDRAFVLLGICLLIMVAGFWSNHFSFNSALLENKTLSAENEKLRTEVVRLNDVIKKQATEIEWLKAISEAQSEDPDQEKK